MDHHEFSSNFLTCCEPGPVLHLRSADEASIGKMLSTDRSNIAVNFIVGWSESKASTWGKLCDVKKISPSLRFLYLYMVIQVGYQHHFSAARTWVHQSKRYPTDITVPAITEIVGGPQSRLEQVSNFEYLLSSAGCIICHWNVQIPKILWTSSMKNALWYRSPVFDLFTLRCDSFYPKHLSPRIPSLADGQDTRGS
jgi:hypothetical protein